MNARDELKLVFPTEEYKEQIEEYLKEHFEAGEYELAGDGGIDNFKYNISRERNKCFARK